MKSTMMLMMNLMVVVTKFYEDVNDHTNDDNNDVDKE
jgi:hypothetical protein